MTAWGSEPGVLRLPDGRLVRGAGTRRPRGDVPPPDLVVLLLGRDPLRTGVAARLGAGQHRWVRWRDFRLPDSTDDALAALREAHQLAATTRVEISCGGGVGRTGTALAVLAVLSGIPATDAVAWTRAHYHPRAVETRRQRAWVEDVATALSRTGAPRRCLPCGPSRPGGTPRRCPRVR